MLDPLPQESWSRRAAIHLLNRAGFGGSPDEQEALFRLGEESGIEDESEYSGVTVRQRNTTSIIMAIIRDICNENNNVATITSIYNRAIAKKIDEFTVDKTVQQLRQSGTLYSSKNDEYSFV